MAEGSSLSGSVMEDAVPLENTGETNSGQTSHRVTRPDSGYQSTVAQRHHQSHTARSIVLHQVPQAGSTHTHRRPRASTPEQTQQQPRHQAPSSAVPAGRSQSSTVASSHEEELSLREDILKGVSKNAEKAVSENELSVLNPSLPSTSSEPPSLETSLSSLVLVPVNDDEIWEHRHKFPDDIKVDYYDAMILYQEEDLPAVEKFLERVNMEVLLNKVEKPKVDLYDNILPYRGITKVGELDITLEYCTYVFLYVTKKFCDDKWAEFCAQAALMNAIDNIESRWSVVPIFTEPKRTPTFKIPPSIRSLKGIQYWSDDKFYVDSLRKLLEDKLHLRLKKEQELKRKRQQWIREHKESERREAELKHQEELHAMELEKEKEKEHQQDLKMRDHYFQQQKFIHQKEKEQKQKIAILSPGEALKGLGYSPLRRTEYDNYFRRLEAQHPTPSNPGAARKSESCGESLDQQGMTELPYMQHSLSLPTCPGKQVSQSNAAPPFQHAATDPQLVLRPDFTPDQCFPAGYQSEWGNPAGYFPATGPTPSPATYSPSVLFYLQNPSTAGLVKGEQAWAAEAGEKQLSLAEDFADAPAQAGNVGQDMKSLVKPLSSSQTWPSGEQMGFPAGNRPVGNQSLEGEKSQAAPSFLGDAPLVRGNPQLVTGHAPSVSGDVTSGKGDAQSISGDAQSVSGAAESVREDPHARLVNPPEKVEFPRKGDLVEDVPLDSRNYQSPYMAGYTQRAGQMLPPQYVSPTVRQPTLVYQGHAHHGNNRVYAAPDRRGDQYYDPHLMHRANIGMQERFVGYMPQHHFRYMTPGHYAEQVQPAYAGHAPGGLSYAEPYTPQYPAEPHYLQHPPPYMPYAVHPEYGVHRFPSQTPGPRLENLQYPGRYPQPWQQSPGVPPPPLSQQQQQQHRPASQQQENQGAVIHHHYHHSDGHPMHPTTINYIKRAENVMVGSEINMGKTKHRPGGESQALPEQEEQSMPEQTYDPENQQMPLEFAHNLQSHDPAGIENVPSAADSSQRSTLRAFSENDHHQSQLTQTVSRDDRSRSTSSETAAMVGLPELRYERYQTHVGEMPPSSSSSSSARFPPLQRESEPVSSCTRNATQCVYEWPQQYEQERETDLKRKVVGPSADDENFSGQDSENTSMKMREPKE